jgi:hypothetical protein
MGPTRWKAHKVFCTTTVEQPDTPGIAYVVKFCQGRHGAAAMISEVLCAGIYTAGGIETLQPVAVHASPSFAESWNQNADSQSTIEPGLYFGTLFREDVLPGPPTSATQVDNLGQLFDIWVFDCWVCNIDRSVLGNVLMTPTRKGKWKMIAADQSDCFCGSSHFGSQDWQERMLGRGRSEGVLVPECIAFHAGVVGLGPRIEKCRVAMRSFGAAVDQVPPQWWVNAGIDPAHVEDTLWQRLERLHQVLNIEEYGEFDYEQFNNVPIL